MFETENRLDPPLWCSCQLPFFLAYFWCILGVSYMNHIFTQIVKLAALNMYIPDPMTTSLQKVKVVEGGKLSAKPVLSTALLSRSAEPKLQAVLQLKQGGAHQVTQTQTKLPPTRPVRSQKAKLHLRLSDKRGNNYKMWRWCFSAERCANRWPAAAGSCGDIIISDIRWEEKISGVIKR